MPPASAKTHRARSGSSTQKMAPRAEPRSEVQNAGSSAPGTATNLLPLAARPKQERGRHLSRHILPSARVEPHPGLRSSLDRGTLYDSPDLDASAFAQQT